jgi:hypothetical protein
VLGHVRDWIPARMRRTAVLSRTLTAAARHAAQVVFVACATLPGMAGAGDDPREALAGEDVTIIAGEDRTVYEYRQNGQLRMVRIVPAFGPPYYLVPADPTRGFGDLEQAGSVVAGWRIVEF